MIFDDEDEKFAMIAVFFQSCEIYKAPVVILINLLPSLSVLGTL